VIYSDLVRARGLFIPLLLAATIGVAGCGEADAPQTPTGGALASRLPEQMPASRGGATFHVDGANGSDEQDGTKKAPWRTLNHALEQVPLSGSVIEVAPGAYESKGSDYVINFGRKGDPKNPITLRARKPGSVRIRNATPNTTTIGAWIHGASGLRIEGFTFEVDGTHGKDMFVGQALIENSDRIEIVDCTFHESGPVEIRGGGEDGQVSEDVWLVRNTFRPSGNDPTAQVTGLTYPVETYGGSKGSHFVYAGQVGNVDKGFEYTSGAERLVVASNVFVGTTPGRHVQLGPQARDSFVVNNTFYGNRPATVLGEDTDAVFAGEGVAFFANTGGGPPATSGNVVANNIFANMDGHAVFGSGPEQQGNTVHTNLPFQVRNGLGHNGDEDDPFLNEFDGNRLFTESPPNFNETDPGFRAAKRFDFRLEVGSRAIGAAVPAFAPLFDRDGKPRSAKPNLGAY
jgi:hypothetical protein